MENQKTYHQELAAICKLYLKDKGLQTYDLRVFEYYDRHETYIKVHSLLLATERMQHTEEQANARNTLLASGLKVAKGGCKFLIALLKD